jgi:HSP20 family protein
VDIREEDKRFVIEADIPGVDPKDIEVNMDKGVLSIRGERKSESKTESGKYSRVERSHGVFYRRFALPDSANPDGISATGRHGVLEIEIPKKPETTPRKIDIRVDG